VGGLQIDVGLSMIDAVFGPSSNYFFGAAIAPYFGSANSSATENEVIFAHRKELIRGESEEARGASCVRDEGFNNFSHVCAAVCTSESISMEPNEECAILLSSCQEIWLRYEKINLIIILN
jgi:hypothetical protein